MDGFYGFVRRLIGGFGGARLDYAFTGLEFTEVDVEALKERSKRDCTLAILEELVV